MVAQQHDVLATLPQRRQEQHLERQPVEQVPLEAPALRGSAAFVNTHHRVW
jgi:hypothetical protein